MSWLFPGLLLTPAAVVLIEIGDVLFELKIQTCRERESVLKMQTLGHPDSSFAVKIHFIVYSLSIRYAITYILGPVPKN